MSDIIIDSDSGKFKAGDGQDLNLYHNGTNSFIENETGILYVTNKANTSLILGTNNTTALTIDNSQNATFAGNLIVGADDAGHDVIFYGDTASSNMTWDTSGDELALNDARLFIDQDDNKRSIMIDSEATTVNTIDAQCDALTTGGVAYFYSNSDSNSSRQLVRIINDHASAVNTIPLKIQQDSTNVVVAIDDPKTTADNIMQITNADALTSGGMLYLESGSTSTGSRKLLHVVNSNSSATGATVLHLHQTAGCEALVIDQDGNSNAIYIDGENTTTPAINVVCDALTSGEGLRVYSNSGDGSNRNLVEIINDHASADNTRGLYIQNDGALYGIEMAGGCGIRFDSTVASADASTLDDYEEGTITPSMSGATSHPTNTFQARGGKYTKIGDRCYWSIRVEMNGSGITPGSGTLSVDGLPFTVLSDDNNQGGISVGHTANWLTGQHGAPTGGFYNTNSTAFFLVVYDNDAGNISGMSYADAADVDDSTTFTASGHYKVA